MADNFEDDGEQTVTIDEYIKGLEDEELVFACFVLFCFYFFSLMCRFFFFSSFFFSLNLG